MGNFRLPQLGIIGLPLTELALRGLLGEGAPLSAGSLMRLKAGWQAEYAAWKRADLSQLELVYCWPTVCTSRPASAIARRRC